MVSSRYFFEVCGAACWKRTPSFDVTSTNLAGDDDTCGEFLIWALHVRAMNAATADSNWLPVLENCILNFKADHRSRKVLLLLIMHSKCKFVKLLASLRRNSLRLFAGVRTRGSIQLGIDLLKIQGAVGKHLHAVPQHLPGVGKAPLFVIEDSKSSGHSFTSWAKLGGFLQ